MSFTSEDFENLKRLSKEWITETVAKHPRNFRLWATFAVGWTAVNLAATLWFYSGYIQAAGRATRARLDHSKYFKEYHSLEVSYLEDFQLSLLMQLAPLLALVMVFGVIWANQKE